MNRREVFKLLVLPVCLFGRPSTGTNRAVEILCTAGEELGNRDIVTLPGGRYGIVVLEPELDPYATAQAGDIVRVCVNGPTIARWSGGFCPPAGTELVAGMRVRERERVDDEIWRWSMRHHGGTAFVGVSLWSPGLDTRQSFPNVLRTKHASYYYRERL
jgi:hypothetical protein